MREGISSRVPVLREMEGAAARSVATATPLHVSSNMTEIHRV